MLITRPRSEPQRFHRWRRGDEDDEDDDDEAEGDVDDGDEEGGDSGIKNKTWPVRLFTLTLCGPVQCAAPQTRWKRASRSKDILL